MLDYYGKLTTLWKELQVYLPVHVCSCGAAAAINKEREEEKVYQFVMGRDDSRFGSICTAIIGKILCLHLEKFITRSSETNKRLASARGREQQQDAMGFLARQSSSVPRREQKLELPSQSGKTEAQNRADNSILRSPLLCSHCERTGHEKRGCWQIVGFPDWYTKRSCGCGQGSGARGRGGRGSAGGRGRGQANVAHATSSNSSSFLEFTTFQWKVLSQMIQEKAGGVSSDKLSGKKYLGDVILDTGASHHMTGDHSLLTTIEMISPCSVAFADGKKTFAMHTGSFPLLSSITLNKVLYVPDLIVH